MVFPWPFSPIKRNALPGLKSEVEILEDAPGGSGISKGNIAEFKAAHDGARGRQAVGLRFDARLHFKERQQIGEEERLVGHAGCGGEGHLDIAHGLHDGGGNEGEIADAVLALDGAVDAVAVGAVVAELAENCEQAAPEKAAAIESDILHVNRRARGRRSGR